MDVCMCVFMYVCIYVFICMFVCVCVYIYLCKYLFIYEDIVSDICRSSIADEVFICNFIVISILLSSIITITIMIHLEQYHTSL